MENIFVIQFIRKIMWLKKKFFRTMKQDSLQNDQAQEIKNFQEEDVMMSSITFDVEPDIRYKKFKEIVHNIEIKFPMMALHQTQNIIIHECNIFNGKVNQNEDWQQINVMMTDRQLLITPNIVQPLGKKAINFCAISYGLIEKAQIPITKKKQALRIKLTLKNMRQIYLKSVFGDLILKVNEILNEFAFVKGINKFYAYRFGQLNRAKEVEHKGWKIYDIKKQFFRQGLLTEDQQGLNLKYISNQNGEVSPTYPQLLVVPSKLTDQQLKKCGQFRTKQRFPALTFIIEYKNNKYSTLFRCSQNKVGVLSARSQEDELMFSYIGDLTGQNMAQQMGGKKNCKIYDARGYYAALGNMIAGKGYQRPQYYKNCEIQWLNIPNIHSIRDSYNMIMSYRKECQSFLALCAQSGWYDYLYLIISGAKSIAKDLLQGINVVVHCSDGWDRTSQLCALSQLIIDPYYRTIEGFAVLIQKDWRHFGHKFRQRTGQYHPTQYHPFQKSPIFIQFLDCVYQIMQQFPLSFEYSDKLLQFLGKNVDSNVYGNFMTNNIQQFKQLQMQQKTISIWSHVLQEISLYKNPFYEPQLQQFWLNVATEAKNMNVWTSWFLGDGITNNMSYEIMKHQIERNKIFQSRYYNNQKQIEILNKNLRDLQ